MSDGGHIHHPSAQDEFVRAAQGVGGTSFHLDRIFSIRDYFTNIFRHWLLFVVAALVGTVWAFYYEAHAPKLYTVSIQVGPVGDAPVQNSGGVSGLVSMFLSGGSMSMGPPEWSRYVYALSSVRLAEKLEREHHLIKKLFAPRWDEKTKSWKPTPGFGAGVGRFFRNMFGFPVNVPPDIKDLQSYLSGNVFLTTDKTTGLTTLSMNSGDPKQAMDFLLMVHHAAVQLVKNEISSRNQAKIAYLTRALGTTVNADQRGILIGMLAQTEQTQMLLNNNLPFAAQIIDTPTIPTQPSTPPMLNVAMEYRIGLLIFLILVVIAIDQISGTNFADYSEAKIRNFPRFIGTLISRFREYGWRGVFSRT
ncbi:MAG: hypothetical protein JSR55_10630 [Proteobacteria bacterium]|nr:hypothetical protein [Pseudomonadota bacterium]